MRIDAQASAPALAKTPIGSSSRISSKDTAEQKRLKGACQEFEALFINTLLKSMRKTVEKSDLFGSDSGEETFQEMMDTEISKSAAKSSSMGIADVMYRQITAQMAREGGDKQTQLATAALKSTEVKADD